MLPLPKTFSAIVYSALFAFGVSLFASAANDKNVVCRVNGFEITEQNMLDTIQKMIQNNPKAKDPATAQKFRIFFYPQALDRLIEMQLIREVAASKKITVDEKKIDQEIQMIQKQVGSLDKLNQLLAQQGLTLDSYKQLRMESQLMSQVFEAEVPKSAPPTDQDVKDFFEKNKSRLKKPEQIRASHILLTVEAGASDEVKQKTKEKLLAIRKDILDGKITFEEAAKTHSDGPSSVKGGDLGFFGKGQMVPSFEQAAFAAKKNEITDIVQTQFGYHIIKVTDRKVPQEPNFDELKGKIAQYLAQNKQQEAQKKYLDGLREKAKIETLIDEKTWRERREAKP